MKKPSNRLIILVDDNEDFAAPLAGAIRQRGFECRYIFPSKVNLSDIASLSCDLLVTDVLMPEVDGLELIRAFRKHFPSTPVVAMSGGGDMLPAGMGLHFSQAFGANTILVKPFTLAEFFAAIDGLLPSAAVPSDC